MNVAEVAGLLPRCSDTSLVRYRRCARSWRAGRDGDSSLWLRLNSRLRAARIRRASHCESSASILRPDSNGPYSRIEPDAGGARHEARRARRPAGSRSTVRGTSSAGSPATRRRRGPTFGTALSDRTTSRTGSGRCATRSTRRPRTYSALKCTSADSQRTTSTPASDLVLRVPHDVGEVGRAWNPAELGHPRPRRLAQQEHDRHRRAEQDTIDGARSQDAEERRHRDEELAPAEPPDVPQGVDVDQAHHRGEHDCGEHGLRQVPQKPRREQDPTTSVNTAAMSPDTGVRAPALSLTSDCDIPPLTGNPRPSPAPTLATPMASSS